MKNRIDRLFEIKKRRILSIFFTAGFPELESTLSIVKELNKAEVDMIELGIPFSDPIADGPIIQQSSECALENGMTLKKLLADLMPLRKVIDKPVLLMGYLNSVLQFGIANFYEACHKAGIDGLILPDLSIDEYISEHMAFSKKYNVHVVFLISPNTSKDRIKLIDQYSKGFIYLVSSNATTGTDNGVSDILEEKIKEINSLDLKNPILMGFGIKGYKEFNKACSLVNGAIVGSAFVSLVAESTDLVTDITEFINNIRNLKKEI